MVNLASSPQPFLLRMWPGKGEWGLGFVSLSPCPQLSTAVSAWQHLLLGYNFEAALVWKCRHGAGLAGCGEEARGLQLLARVCPPSGHLLSSFLLGQG